MIEKVKSLLSIVLVSLAPLILLGFASICLISIYKPIRLYATGQNTKMVLIDKQIEYSQTKAGPVTKGYSVKVSGSKDKVVFNSRKIYENLKIGETINVFYSKKNDFGIISKTQKPSLLYCLNNTNGFLSFVIWLSGFILIYIVFKIAFDSLKIELKTLINSYKEEEFIKGKLKTIEIIAMGKKLTPDLIIISALYLLSLIAIKTIIYVEQSDDLTSGSVLFISLLIISFFPTISLRIKNLFKKNIILKSIISILKIILGIYTLVKTIIFIENNPINEFTEFEDFIVKFLKFLVNI